MAMFDPPGLPAPTLPTAPAMSAPAPLAPDLPPPLPPPIPMRPIKLKPNQWDSKIVRKAQGIYPAEKQEKQQMMNNAQAAMPTPTGPWGSPK